MSVHSKKGAKTNKVNEDDSLHSFFAFFQKKNHERENVELSRSSKQRVQSEKSIYQ